MSKPLQTPCPPPLEAHLGFWLRFVSNQVSQRFRQLLEEQGASVTDWVTLRSLWAGEVSTRSGLIEVLGMTKGAVSKVVARLEQRGLLEGLPMEAGQREQRLVLTVEGQHTVPRLAALAEANEVHFFGHLPCEERRMLMQAMKALVHHHRMTSFPTV